MRSRIKASFPLQLSAIHFFLVLACAGFSFYSLTNWDGEWYRQIVDIGYNTVHSADPNAEGHGNVGFFPGYPFVAYLLKKILGLGSDALPTTAALLIAANGFAVLTWIYLEKWIGLFVVKRNELRRSNPLSHPDPIQVRILLLAFYPYVFFLYCAYSESLFTSMFLGFFFFSEKFLTEADRRKSWRWFFLAILHGFFMNFTRMVGMVVVVYPVLRAFQLRTPVKKKLEAFAVGAISLLGIVTFFLYCELKFGDWNLYSKTVRTIWNVYVDYAKLFPPRTLFDFSRPLHANTVGKYITILTGAFLGWQLFRALKEKRFSEPYFSVILISGMLWGETLLGRTSWDFVGMGRYLIPLLALNLPFVKIEPRLNWKWIAICALMIGFQIAYALKFGRHGWVA